MAESSKSCLETAECCLEQGDSARAERLCRRALAKNQNDAEALRLLAPIARRGGKLDEAIAACSCTLGQLLNAAGRHAQAIVELQSAVEKHPAVAQAHLLRAMPTPAPTVPPRRKMPIAPRSRAGWTIPRRI